MSVELALVALQSRCSGRFREDVSLDEILAVRALLKAFLQAVCDFAALEFVLGGLEGSVGRDDQQLLRCICVG